MYLGAQLGPVANQQVAGSATRMEISGNSWGDLGRVVEPASPVYHVYCYLYLNSYLEMQKGDTVEHISSYFV